MKTALVTGGSRGIGRAVCRQLAQDGYRVIIGCCSHLEQELELQRELEEKTGLEHRAIQADLRREEEIARLFQEAGPVDLLVNNAGIARQTLFTDVSAEEWDDLFAVNVRGAFLCTRYALPEMIRKKEGCVIFISSMWGQVGASCEAVYSASKAALIGLTKALAKEEGPSGIRVNCIAPGVIHTEMNAGLSSEDLEALRQETPLERIGTPEDIARAVSFLAGEKASFITGQVLGVNGGFVI